jgi:cytochrome bd-type quinol oxidase subunit 1
MKDWVLFAVSNVDVARLQFAATSIFHFLFVPITIGMAFLTAILQTKWHRSGDEDMLRVTRFFGVLLIINVAVGVVTGLVQEFQFGMNWSSYSRYVGDVFGAPLAMEGLIAFFLESTFLGVWLFGWNRLPKRLHLASIWLVAFGTLFSAAFIIAANSWMQHPVGYEVVNGRAELTSIWAVLGSSFFLLAFAHVILAAFVTGAILMLAVSAWHMKRKQETGIFRRTARLALFALAPAALLAVIVGSELGVVVTNDQPMKIAASEALWNTEQPASFSLFQIGGFSKDDPTPSFDIEIPYLLSFLATNDPNAAVQGMNQIQAKYEKQYGPGDYYPHVAAQYWSMRVMAYLAGLSFLLSLWGLWLLRKNRIDNARWFQRLAIWAVLLPIAMNTAGWVLTEMGRQPWIVQGLQLTQDGVSPSVSTTSIYISLVIFVLIYGSLAILDAALMIRFARRDLPSTPTEPEGGSTTASIVY